MTRMDMSATGCSRSFSLSLAASRSLGFGSRAHKLGRAVCFALTFVLSLLQTGCNGGLNPADYSQKASINGTVYFVRGAGSTHFPAKDSLLDLRVVAFHNQPKDTNLINELGSGTAIFSLTLMDSTFNYPASLRYSLDVPQNQLTSGFVDFHYVAVAQRYGPNITSDWKVAGLYSLDSIYTPANVRVSTGVDVQGVDFNVDFLKPPPQPFKR